MLDHATNEHIGWTEERTEYVKKRWAEGASATLIATELGGGVTRNGVIGKVSRLKLKSHGPNAVKSSTRMAKRTPEQIAEDSRVRSTMMRKHGNAGHPKAAAIVHRAEMKKRGAQGLAFKLNQARKDGLSGPEALEAVLGRQKVEMPEFAEDGVDVTHLIGLMQLTDQTCRYPIGDPLEAGFGFCGGHTQTGSKYCAGHHKRVYLSF